jgi:hypothetical protein
MNVSRKEIDRHYMKCLSNQNTLFKDNCVFLVRMKIGKILKTNPKKAKKKVKEKDYRWCQNE